MRIRFKDSIKGLIDTYIHEAKLNNNEIDSIDLSEAEYIELLEDLGVGTERILLSLKPRVYKGVRLKVMT